jgi:hypothetical protein
MMTGRSEKLKTRTATLSIALPSAKLIGRSPVAVGRVSARWGRMVAPPVAAGLAARPPGHHAQPSVTGRRHARGPADFRLPRSRDGGHRPAATRRLGVAPLGHRSQAARGPTRHVIGEWLDRLDHPPPPRDKRPASPVSTAPHKLGQYSRALRRLPLAPHRRGAVIIPVCLGRWRWPEVNGAWSLFRFDRSSILRTTS